MFRVIIYTLFTISIDLHNMPGNTHYREKYNYTAGLQFNLLHLSKQENMLLFCL